MGSNRIFGFSDKIRGFDDYQKTSSKNIKKSSSSRIENEFLLKKIDYSLEINELKEFILKNCKSFTSLMNGKKFYIGRKNISKTVATIKENKLREKSSNKELADYFNSMISDKGEVANRSNSVFVFTSVEKAKEYGDVFQIIPIGEWNYTWNKNIIDFQKESQELANKIETNPNFIQTEESKKIYNGFHCDFGHELFNNNFGHEIMIHANKYLLVHSNIASWL